jgi:branched-chain amino acid transport system permease protein
VSAEAAERLPRERLLDVATPSARPQWAFVLPVVPVLLVLPLALDRMDGGRFWLHLLIIFFVWAIVTQSWNLIMAVAGIYSFGQIALYAVGGWVTGMLAKHLDVDPWLSIWLAPVAAAIAAVIIGLPTLRLRGIYVVLITLAFLELLRNFLVNSPYEWISGGGYGLLYVPKLSFGSLGEGHTQVMFYYVAFAFFAVATYWIWRMFHSPLGMAFTALRDSEAYAVSRGVNQFRARLSLFAFSAFFTGLAGGFMTHYQGSISPSVLSFGWLITLLAMIVIGGWGTFWGPIFGTAFIILLEEKWLRSGGFVENQLHVHNVEEYRRLLLGLALAVIAVVAPQGLFPVVRDGLRRLIRGPQGVEEEEEEEAALDEAGGEPQLPVDEEIDTRRAPIA